MESNLEKYHFSGASFFDLLTPPERKFVEKHVVRKEYKKGQILFKEKTSSRGVYLLRKGKVKLFQINRDGKENIVYIYKKGEYFGYRPLLSNEPHPATATAIDSAVTLFIPEKIFFELLNKSRSLAGHLLVSLAHEFAVWINKLTVFSQYSVKERVVVSLLILMDIYKNPKSPKSKVVISLNRDDLAGFVGTAKETVVRVLRVLKDEKIISTKGTKITILKQAELFRMINFL